MFGRKDLIGSIKLRQGLQVITGGFLHNDVEEVKKQT